MSNLAEIPAAATCHAEGVTYPYAPGQGWVEASEEAWGLVVLDNRFLRLALEPGVTGESCRSLDVEGVELAPSGTTTTFDLDLDQGDGIGFAPRVGRLADDHRYRAATCDAASGPVDLTLTRDVELDVPRAG